MNDCITIPFRISDNAVTVIVTITIAIISGIYAVITNTKKYELTENYRCEIMSWYKEVVRNMILMIVYCGSNTQNLDSFLQIKNELLANLSSLAEIGRIYFPNIIRDEFGKEKPSAYRGYRHIVTEFIIQFYLIASKEIVLQKDLHSLWNLERHFTSFVFDMFKPRKRNKEYAKYLSITIPKGQSIEDYLSQSPEIYSAFF